MKKIIISIVGLFLLSFSVSLYSQETERPAFGVGVSVYDVRELVPMIVNGGEIAPSVIFTFNVSPAFRIEPEIGYFSTKVEDKLDNMKNKISTDAFILGVGLFSLKEMEDYNLYYGARVGYLHTSTTEEFTMGGSDKDESSSDGFFIAPCVGGEYYLSRHFSVGAEAQLRYTSSSGEETDETSGTTDISSSWFTTKTFVLLRFYF